MTSDVQWQNYLDEATNAILTGDDKVDNIRSRYGIPYSGDHDLIELVESLDQSLNIVEPPAQFRNRLKDELLGSEQSSVVRRIRRLPARVQLAAIAAAFLGGVFIFMQRFNNASSSFSEERTRLPEEG